MEGGIGGIGRFRDIGDPYDPRRQIGSRPIIPSDLDPELLAGRGRTESVANTTRNMRERMKLQDPRMATGTMDDPSAKSRIGNLDRADLERMTDALFSEKDPEAAYPASLYPARTPVEDKVGRELMADIQARLPKYGLPRDNQEIPDAKKVIKKGGLGDEEEMFSGGAGFVKGSNIPTQYTPEPAAYGGVDVPVVGKDRQVRGTKRIYPSDINKAMQGRADDEVPAKSLGGTVKDLRSKMTTPLVRFGDVIHNANFEISRTESGRIGYLLEGEDPDGRPIRTPVYETDIFVKGEPMARVGNPTSVDFDGIRDALKETGDPAFFTRIERDRRKGGRLVETGPLPFANRRDIYAGLPGMRGAYEGRQGDTGISKEVGMDFKTLLGELAKGDFMSDPTVVNAFRSLESNDPGIDRRIFSLRAAAERTTVPGKAEALIRAADNLEAGIALVRAEKMGREVDIQAFDPDYDGPIGRTDVAKEILELSQDELSDFDFESSGEERPQADMGYRISYGDEDPFTYRAGAPGPVRIVQQAAAPVEQIAEEMLQNSGKISAGAANALRRQYANPKLAGIISALSQPEALVTDDRTQAAFDQRLALIGSQQGREINPDSASAINAPANVGSVEEQRALIEQIPQGARQNVVRGLAEGASPASRNAAFDFLNRFRNKMMNR
tara:strand:- start:8366 stop:10372 length:2007 start_codon:yes stop_codon:yes gene_type:complete